MDVTRRLVYLLELDDVSERHSSLRLKQFAVDSRQSRELFSELNTAYRDPTWILSDSLFVEASTGDLAVPLYGYRQREPGVLVYRANGGSVTDRRLNLTGYTSSPRESYILGANLERNEAYYYFSRMRNDLVR